MTRSLSPRSVKTTDNRRPAPGAEARFGPRVVHVRLHQQRLVSEHLLGFLRGNAMLGGALGQVAGVPLETAALRRVERHRPQRILYPHTGQAARAAECRFPNRLGFTALPLKSSRGSRAGVQDDFRHFQVSVPRQTVNTGAPIDRLLHDLAGLTEDEIEIVEGATA